MLTSESRSGIKSGYWSAEKKDKLVQKLGRIEDRAPSLIEQACIALCEHKGPMNAHYRYCIDCPLIGLRKIVEED